MPNVIINPTPEEEKKINARLSSSKDNFFSKENVYKQQHRESTYHPTLSEAEERERQLEASDMLAQEKFEKYREEETKKFLKKVISFKGTKKTFKQLIEEYNKKTGENVNTSHTQQTLTSAILTTYAGKKLVKKLPKPMSSRVASAERGGEVAEEDTFIGQAEDTLGLRRRGATVEEEVITSIENSTDEKLLNTVRIGARKTIAQAKVATGSAIRSGIKGVKTVGTVAYNLATGGYTAGELVGGLLAGAKTLSTAVLDAVPITAVGMAMEEATNIQHEAWYNLVKQHSLNQSKPIIPWNKKASPLVIWYTSNGELKTLLNNGEVWTAQPNFKNTSDAERKNLGNSSVAQGYFHVKEGQIPSRTRILKTPQDVESYIKDLRKQAILTKDNKYQHTQKPHLRILDDKHFLINPPEFYTSKENKGKWWNSNNEAIAYLAKIATEKRKKEHPEWYEKPKQEKPAIPLAVGKGGAIPPTAEKPKSGIPLDVTVTDTDEKPAIPPGDEKTTAPAPSPSPEPPLDTAPHLDVQEKTPPSPTASGIAPDSPTASGIAPPSPTASGIAPISRPHDINVRINKPDVHEGVQKSGHTQRGSVPHTGYFGTSGDSQKENVSMVITDYITLIKDYASSAILGTTLGYIAFIAQKTLFKHTLGRYFFKRYNRFGEVPFEAGVAVRTPDAYPVPTSLAGEKVAFGGRSFYAQAQMGGRFQRVTDKPQYTDLFSVVYEWSKFSNLAPAFMLTTSIITMSMQDLFRLSTGQSSILESIPVIGKQVKEATEDFVDDRKAQAVFNMANMLGIEFNSSKDTLKLLRWGLYIVRKKPTRKSEWNSFVDETVEKFEQIFGYKLSSALDKDTIQSLNNFTGNDMSFMLEERRMIEEFYKLKEDNGRIAVDYIFKNVVNDLSEEKIDILDNSNWLPNLFKDFSLSLTGSNFKESLPIVGFVLYNKRAQPLTESGITQTRPFSERFQGKLFQYGEFGGRGNLIENNEAIGFTRNKPIDKLDALFKQHDENYHKMGDWSREADLILVEGINNLLKTENLDVKTKQTAESVKWYFSNVIFN